MVHSSSDIRVAGCDVCASLSSPSDHLLVSLLPPVLQCCRDKNTAVKATAEKAVSNLIQGEAHLRVSHVIIVACSGEVLKSNLILRVEGEVLKAT